MPASTPVEPPKNYTPKHPLYTAQAETPEETKLEESEGFLDRFRGAKTLRQKLKKLCAKLGKPVPANIDKMSKKELLKTLKQMKPKKGSSNWKAWDTLMRGLGDIAQALN